MFVKEVKSICVYTTPPMNSFLFSSWTHLLCSGLEFDTFAEFDSSWLFVTRKIFSFLLFWARICDDICETLICLMAYVCRTLPVSLIWDSPSTCSSGRGRRAGTWEIFVQCSNSINVYISGTPAHFKLPVLNCTASICISFLLYESLAKPMTLEMFLKFIHL